MKKKVFKILMIFLSVFLGLKTTYASSVTISTSQSSVTKGNTVKVTVKVNADAGIYTIAGSASCTGAGATGGVDLRFEDLNTSSTSKSFTFNIKPTSTGKVNCSTSNVSIRELSKDSEYTLSNASATINVVEPVKVPQREYDSNNFLKELSIEGQNITPAFHKDITEYNISLDQSVEKIVVNAKAESDKASISGTGEKALSSGENTIEIKVTAENGNEKIYKIIVKVEDQHPISVEINKKKYTVVKKNNNLVEKLENYEETSIKIEDQDVVAYTNSKTKVTLVLLKDEKNQIHYFVYNTQSKEYSEYHFITVQGVTLQLLDNLESLKYYTKYQEKVGTEAVTIYKIKKTHKVGLIYGTNVKTGNTGYYVYDRNEETLSKYYDEEVKVYQKQLESTKNYLMIFMGIVAFVVIVTIIVSLVHGKKKKKKRMLVK